MCYGNIFQTTSKQSDWAGRNQKRLSRTKNTLKNRMFRFEEVNFFLFRVRRAIVVRPIPIFNCIYFYTYVRIPRYKVIVACARVTITASGDNRP